MLAVVGMLPGTASPPRAHAAEGYGGIHFRSDNDVGLALGRRVGREAVRAYGLER